MEVQKKEVSFQSKIHSQRSRLLEMQEKEKVRSRKRFSSKRKRFMEVQKKEAVLVRGFEVCSWLEEFASEKELCMEKKEASPFEIPLRHLQLEPWHHFSAQDP